MMEREPVSSSNLTSVGYDAESETLEVEFKNTGVYQYFNVPPFMHERLMSADSVGKFFNAEIKNAYPCSRV
jgi:hypothetical protein